MHTGLKTTGYRIATHWTKHIFQKLSFWRFYRNKYIFKKWKNEPPIGVTQCTFNSCEHRMNVNKIFVSPLTSDVFRLAFWRRSQLEKYYQGHFQHLLTPTRTKCTQKSDEITRLGEYRVNVRSLKIREITRIFLRSMK